MDLKEGMKVLSLANSKGPHPVYAEYIKSDGEKLISCDDNTYISIDYEAPFIGTVNAFVLNSFLKKNLSFEIEKTDEGLLLKNNGYKTTLIVDDFIDIPEVTINNIEYEVEVTKEMIDALNLAYRFVGNDNMEYIYVGNNKICASDLSRLIMIEGVYITDEAFLIDKKILQALIPGCKIGKDSETGSTYVKWDFGYGIFTVDEISTYPFDKLFSFYDKACETRELLCNVASIKEAVDNVSHIFYGENETVIQIKNNNYKMIISAESALNGVVKKEFESLYEGKASLRVDVNNFKNIPLNLDVFISLSSKMDTLVLDDDDSCLTKIIILGEK